MLAHQPEVTRLIHREYVQQRQDDAQQPMQSIWLPAHGFNFPHVLSRIAAFAHVGPAPRHRGVHSGS
jgi:hypothetical protein